MNVNIVEFYFILAMFLTLSVIYLMSEQPNITYKLK